MPKDDGVDWDTASRCPKCNQHGEQQGEPKPIPMSSNKNFEFKCMTVICPWYGTPYWASKMPNGNAPTPKPRRIKTYSALPTADEAAAIAAIERMRKASQQPGGAEIR